MNELFDSDGYPSEHSLELIANWDISKVEEWFAFIEKLWYYDTCIRSQYFDEEHDRWKTRYELHTMGWSGNESIIQAMSENIILWSMTWFQSRRGGHYVFEINDKIALA
jgi:hypothetical protein